MVRNIELATAEHYLVSMGVGNCGCLLVFLVSLGKEFKNELKKKFKDNFISLKEKHPRAGELQISAAAQRKIMGKGEGRP